MWISFKIIINNLFFMNLLLSMDGIIPSNSLLYGVDPSWTEPIQVKIKDSFYIMYDSFIYHTCAAMYLIAKWFMMYVSYLMENTVANRMV